MSDDQEIIAEFVVESREHLADIESQILSIEAAGANIDLDVVNQVFRAVHSIKGAAGFLGFTTLSTLAHELENALNLIRNQQLVPNAAIADVMLRASDTLQRMLDDIDNSNQVDISDHLSSLEQVVAGLLSEDSAAPTPEPAAPESPAAEPVVVETTAAQPSEDEPVVAESDASEPVPEPALTEPMGETPAAEPETPVPAPVAAAPQQAAAPTVPEPSTVASNKPTSSAAPPVENNIRVAVSVIDRLMNLAGELVLSRNQLLQSLVSKQSGGLESVGARINQVTSELQETIMQARLQAVGTVFNKFPRLVRDLSHKLDKRVDLRLEGTDVELDKSIIEAIGDPLTHLIRNAMDHGLETPAQRVAAGKPETGTILLKAYHQAGKVNIAIMDNGRGIDAAKLKEKAVSRGIITPSQAAEMSEREAVRLIFRPSFSTAEQVTGVSGRGVGMDVVKTNIERLGGSVGIETEVGVGTTINVTLPLTLAIIPSLIVQVGQRRFAIPQGNIAELVRIKAEDVDSKIQRINKAELFRLRGHLIPIVHLSKALDFVIDELPEVASNEDEMSQGHDPLATNKALNMIVVETGQLRYGIIVEALQDSEEIVVKPLGRHMKDCPCLAGATILGDGAVAMILDASGIASHCELALPEENDLRSDAEVESDLADDIQTILLFNNHTDERFGLPMDLIDRVERIRTDQIESVGGKLVMQYRGVSLPLIRLEDCVTAQPAAEHDKVYVAVFSVSDHEVGLIVPELVDVRRVPTNIDALTFQEAGIFGSLVIDDHATRLLDLYGLVEQVRPEWFADRQRVTQAVNRSIAGDDGGAPRILLAEDSGFFRKQLVGFLENEGWEVVDCEDGQIAWDTLNDAKQQFQLIITDLEMPNMNGLELSRRIKQSAYAHLPIVAVTSLAGADDIERGKAAGIDEYHIKLDRERLIEAVTRLLREQQAVA